MTNETKFAEMLCTRFCHDIIGPVGAVSNGAEFLREEMPDVKSQAIDLIEKSSKEAVARVQFYRQAYGLGLQDSVASLNEAKTIVENFFSTTKIELDWDERFSDRSGIEINYAQKKVILNTFIVAAATLIRGGKITFTLDSETATITAAGTSIRLDPAVEALLTAETPATTFDAKSVQIAYTNTIALQIGAKISISKATESITFTIKLK